MMDPLRITYSSIGKLSASLPLVLPVGPSTFSNPANAYASLQTAIRSAVARLAVAVAAGGAQALVATMALAWPSSLGNSDRRYLISTPLNDLSPPGGPDLAALALISDSIDVPYLLAGSENESDLGLYVVSGGKPVAVRPATFDAERQVYSLILDNPQRILTWTPVNAPGSEQGSSTSLPPAPPGTVVYSGSSLNPVSTEQESYPALDLDQERLIITFPVESGLPPILVVFKSPRFEPGTAIGTGTRVIGLWLEDASRGEGAPIPTQVAKHLRGEKFRNFDAFRRKFWKTVANDPDLSTQFEERSLLRMRKHGYAPGVDDLDIYI